VQLLRASELAVGNGFVLEWLKLFQQNQAFKSLYHFSSRDLQNVADRRSSNNGRANCQQCPKEECFSSRDLQNVADRARNRNNGRARPQQFSGLSV
jgi:hypothetical protein